MSDWHKINKKLNNLDAEDTGAALKARAIAIAGIFDEAGVPEPKKISEEAGVITFCWVKSVRAEISLAVPAKASPTLTINGPQKLLEDAEEILKAFMSADFGK